MIINGGASTSRFRSTTTRLVTAAAGVLMLTAQAATADAADRVVGDRGGFDDTTVQDRSISFGELRALRVRHETRRLVVRFVPGRGTGSADFYDVFVDTDRDGRPERRVQFDNAYGPTRFAQAYRADGYGTFPVRSREVCSRVPTRLEGGARRPLTVTLRIPLRCLGGPTPAVRVVGFTAMEYGIADWVSAPRRLSAPIRRG